MRKPREAPRYFLRAYVCDDGKVRWQPTVGSMEFSTIFVQRPNGCRYALLERITGPNTSLYIVADLYDTQRAPDGTLVMGEHRSYPDWDAALAAAVLTY